MKVYTRWRFDSVESFLKLSSVDEIITDPAAVPNENISPLEVKNSQSEVNPEVNPDEASQSVPAASPTQEMDPLDSMSADEKNALLQKLLAAQSQQQPVAQQSADLILGQVSAAQSALKTAEEPNPEAPISDPVPPMMMTGTNPAVYSDVPQTADQPADQSANYPNEYGSRADPDNTEAPGMPDNPVEDVLPESGGEPEVESEPELISSETADPVAPIEPVSNLGSPIQTAPEVSAPVSPEISELPETSEEIESESDIQSDIEELAASIPDSPHLPIDLKTSNVDASDYETGKLLDLEDSIS